MTDLYTEFCTSWAHVGAKNLSTTGEGEHIDNIWMCFKYAGQMVG